MKTTLRAHVLVAAIGAVCLSAPTWASDSDFSNGITVDSTADAPDANVGDGICADSQGRCTLRAAIQEANAHAGEDTVDLSQINDPNNPIILTINGTDETWQTTGSTTTPFEAVDTPDASKGDLDITDSIRIVGAGSSKTIIEWSAASRTDGDPSTGDRVFQAQALTGNITVYISGLTIMNGSVGIPNSTDPANPYNLQVNGDGSIWQFKRFGGAITFGKGDAVSLYTATAHGGSGGNGGNGGSSSGESGYTIESATLNDVVLADNSSGSDGGGLYNTAPITIENSVVWGNTAGANGGGIYNDGAMTLMDSSIGTLTSNTSSTANTAENGGGLFDTGAHTSTILRTAINGNTATGGGGIAARSLVRVDITNSTLNGNTGNDVGGGITTNGTINLLNSTVTDNKSGSDSANGGAGLNSFGNGTYQLKNTLLANNQSANAVANCGCTGGECTSSHQFSSLGHNLEDANTCSLNATGDLPNTAPQLKALANNGGLSDTRALPSIQAGDSVTSPAIDAANDSGCPNNDQRKSLRPADGNLDGIVHCDIGAYEAYIVTADLQIRDLIAPDQVAKNTTTPVTITVLNGDTTQSATGVTLTTDALPADVTINSATYTVGSSTTANACSISSQTVSCAIGTLTASQTAKVSLSLTPTAVGTRTLTAHVSASTPADANLTNNTASATINVIGSSDLALSGTISNPPLYVFHEAIGQFTIVNKGPNAATSPRFAGTVSGDVTLKSISSSQGSCRITDDGYVCDLNTLAVGASAVINVSATVNKATTLTFQAQALAEPETDPDTTNNSATITVSVTEGANGGGGCSFDPKSPFDPTMPALLLLGIGGLILRRNTPRHLK